MKEKKQLPGIGIGIEGAFLLLLFFFSCAALANMSVYPMELNVDTSGVAVIKVASKSDDIQFVRVTQKKIINPGTSQEKEVDVPSWEKGGMVVTPSKFALAAGSMRVVRLVSMTPPEKETTWRIYFEGVKQPSDFLSMKGKDSSAEEKLGVNIIWGALVHLAPENPLISLSVNPERGEVINNGTIRIPLKEIGICQGTSSCKWVKEDATIYPGMRKTLKSLSFNGGSKYKIRYFNWLSKTSEEAEPLVAN